MITENRNAIKTYRNIGFEIIRTLNCYKGTLNVEDAAPLFEVSELSHSDGKSLDRLCNYGPTWQNTSETIENLYKINDIKSIGAVDQNEVIGYVIFNNTSQKILQIGIREKYDQNRVVNLLFKFISDNYTKEVLAINIDDSAKNTISGFNSLGLNCFLKQYEMKMELHKKA